MKNLLCVVVSVLLFGCASTKPPEPVVKTVRVEVPVEVPCKVETPVKPRYNFDVEATTSMSLAESVSLLLLQDYNLKGYVIELETALSSCTSK